MKRKLGDDQSKLEKQVEEDTESTIPIRKTEKTSCQIGVVFPSDVWLGIAHECDGKTLLQLLKTSKFFETILDMDDHLYCTLYLYMWREYYDHGEKRARKNCRIYEGPSNFVDRKFTNESTGFWKERYLHRLKLMPKMIKHDKLKQLASALGLEHSQKSNCIAVFDLNESNDPKSRKFVFIGPSTVPLTIQTEIRKFNEYKNAWFFRASGYSYLANDWSKMISIHPDHEGDEDHEFLYPVFYAVSSLLYGRNVKIPNDKEDDKEDESDNDDKEDDEDEGREFHQTILTCCGGKENDVTYNHFSYKEIFDRSMEELVF